MSRFARRLRSLRGRAKLTQGELAAKAGGRQNTVCRIEIGVIKNPTTKTVRGLARALGVSVEDLLGTR